MATTTVVTQPLRMLATLFLDPVALLLARDAVVAAIVPCLAIVAPVAACLALASFGNHLRLRAAGLGQLALPILGLPPTIALLGNPLPLLQPAVPRGGTRRRLPFGDVRCRRRRRFGLGQRPFALLPRAAWLLRGLPFALPARHFAPVFATPGFALARRGGGRGETLEALHAPWRLAAAFRCRRRRGIGVAPGLDRPEFCRHSVAALRVAPFKLYR